MRYSIAWTIFIYSVVSVSRNIVRYNKYLIVVTVVVVLSVITGSIARSANLPVFSLLRGRF